MTWSATAAALLLAAAPLAVAAQSQTTNEKASEQSITLQGCVRAGLEKDAVLMTDVTEVTGAGKSGIPAEAHGRKVIFWLDKDDLLKPHVGKMVRVTGKNTGIEESEIEFKAGRQKDGGLAVEFEGPGKDVTASTAVVGPALGTSGRAADEKDDIKTFLFKVNVDTVTPTTGPCR